MIGKRRASWDKALDLVARRFRETIERHGPGSVAFYVSGQLLTEDYYVANKLMKGFLGSANVELRIEQRAVDVEQINGKRGNHNFVSW